MDLTQAMLAATQDPPPTSIEVDQLIAGERRRTRRLHAVTGAALVAVLAVGVVGVVKLRQPSEHTPGAAPPSVATTEPAWSCGMRSQVGDEFFSGLTPLVPVTERCDIAAERLGAALSTALTTQLPDVPLTPPLPAEVAKVAQVGAGYIASLIVPGGWLEVRLRGSETTTAEFTAWRESQCGQVAKGDTCRGETRDGSQLLIRVTTGARTVEVWALHPDGTMVGALARGTTSITEQELIGIAATPELTVYP